MTAVWQYVLFGVACWAISISVLGLMRLLDEWREQYEPKFLWDSDDDLAESA